MYPWLCFIVIMENIPEHLLGIEVAATSDKI